MAASCFTLTAAKQVQSIKEKQNLWNQWDEALQERPARQPCFDDPVATTKNIAAESDSRRLTLSSKRGLLSRRDVLRLVSTAAMPHLVVPTVERREVVHTSVREELHKRSPLHVRLNTNIPRDMEIDGLHVDPNTLHSSLSPVFGGKRNAVAGHVDFAVRSFLGDACHETHTRGDSAAAAGCNRDVCAALELDSLYETCDGSDPADAFVLLAGLGASPSALDAASALSVGIRVGDRCGMDGDEEQSEATVADPFAEWMLQWRAKCLDTQGRPTTRPLSASSLSQRLTGKASFELCESRPSENGKAQKGRKQGKRRPRDITVLDDRKSAIAEALRQGSSATRCQPSGDAGGTISAEGVAFFATVANPLDFTRRPPAWPTIWGEHVVLSRDTTTGRSNSVVEGSNLLRNAVIGNAKSKITLADAPPVDNEASFPTVLSAAEPVLRPRDASDGISCESEVDRWDTLSSPAAAVGADNETATMTPPEADGVLWGKLQERGPAALSLRVGDGGRSLMSFGAPKRMGGPLKRTLPRGAADLMKEKVHKYKWDTDALLRKPFMSPTSAAFFPSFCEHVAAAYTGPTLKVLRPHVDPSPTRREALVVAVSVFTDTVIPPYPQAARDGDALAHNLKEAGFSVVLLSSTAEDDACHPTLKNVIAAVARLLALQKSNRLAALQIIFVSRGGIYTSLSMSDHQLRMAACEDSRVGQAGSFWPVDYIASLRYETVLTVADLAGLYPHPGIGYIHAEGVGGHLEFQYPALGAFKELHSAVRGVLVGLWTKAWRGKGSRDQRITPNSLNVFVAERLMRRKFKFFSSASPLQSGSWDLIPLSALMKLRNHLRGWRRTKRMEFVSYRIGALVQEQYGRNLQTVASQMTSKIRSTAAFNVKDDYFVITSIYPTGILYLCFRTKDSFNMGIIEADGFCRRTFGFACSPVREAASLSLRINVPSNDVPQCLAKLRSHASAKSLVANVFMDVEICASMNRRAEMKLDNFMRFNLLTPSVVLTGMTPDKEQMLRIHSTIVIQAYWRRHYCRRRFLIFKHLSYAHQEAAKAVEEEWEQGCAAFVRELYHNLIACLLHEEELVRVVENQVQDDHRWMISREYLASHARIVLRGRAPYAATLRKGGMQRIKRALVSVANLTVQRDAAALRQELGIDSDDDSSDVTVVRNRMAIEQRADRIFLQLCERCLRGCTVIEQAQHFNSMPSLLTFPLQEDQARWAIRAEQHAAMLVIVAFARQKLVIPSSRVPPPPSASSR